MKLFIHIVSVVFLSAGMAMKIDCPNTTFLPLEKKTIQSSLYNIYWADRYWRDWWLGDVYYPPSLDKLSCVQFSSKSDDIIEARAYTAKSDKKGDKISQLSIYQLDVDADSAIFRVRKEYELQEGELKLGHMRGLDYSTSMQIPNDITFAMIFITLNKALRVFQACDGSYAWVEVNDKENQKRLAREIKNYTYTTEYEGFLKNFKHGAPRFVLNDRFFFMKVGYFNM